MRWQYGHSRNLTLVWGDGSYSWGWVQQPTVRSPPPYPGPSSAHLHSPRPWKGSHRMATAGILTLFFFFPDCSYVMFISDYLLSSKKCRGKSLILSFRDNCCIFKSGLLRVSYGKIPSLWHTFLWFLTWVVAWSCITTINIQNISINSPKQGNHLQVV